MFYFIFKTSLKLNCDRALSVEGPGWHKLTKQLAVETTSRLQPPAELRTSCCHCWEHLGGFPESVQSSFPRSSTVNSPPATVRQAAAPGVTWVSLLLSGTLLDHSGDLWRPCHPPCDQVNTSSVLPSIHHHQLSPGKVQNSRLPPKVCFRQQNTADLSHLFRK